MLHSMGSGTFCQAPTLPNTSRGGGSYCPTRLSQLSYKVVLIVRLSLFCQTIKTILKQKYRAVYIHRQGCSIYRNGQNLLVNVDHQISLFGYSVSISFKYILVRLNQYKLKEITVDT